MYMYIHVLLTTLTHFKLNTCTYIYVPYREVKVHVSKPGGVGRFMSTLTRKKNNTATETFRLTLKKELVSLLGIMDNVEMFVNY